MSTRPRDVHRSALARGLAVLLALALLPAVWLLLAMFLLGGLVSAQVPDPAVSDGDPCCGYPDTWGEVSIGFVWTVAFGMALALVLWSIVVLVRRALNSSPPSGRSWRIAAGVGAFLAVLGFGASLAVSASAREVTDCTKYKFRPDRIRSAERDVRRAEAFAITDCQPLGDMTPAQVRKFLGAPTHERRPNDDLVFWRYTDLEVEFLDGRAIDAQIYPYIDR